MKKLFLIMTLILLIIPPASYASDLIPPYHWTYHSLEVLSDKGIIKEKIIPGESAYTKEQAAKMIIEAIKKIRTEPSIMKDDELYSMRQLINGYRKELEAEGRDFHKIRTELEDLALAANLTAMEISDTPSSKERPLNFQAVKSVNRFAFDIYRYLAEKGRGSFLVSPYSISSALSMAYAGAEGETAREMEKVLYLSPYIHRSMAALINDINSVPGDTAIVKTANALWPAKNEYLLASYTDKMRHFYGASVTPLDYIKKTEEARDIINNWVDRKTEGKIKDMIGGGVLRRDTLMVLTNAVYFKSDWMIQFDPQNSRAMPFYISRSESVPTVMMTKFDQGVKYYKDGELEIAGIPYRDNRFTMMIVLPQKGVGLDNIEKELDYLKLTEWDAFMSQKKVRLTIPKFKVEKSLDLCETLNDMGMGATFSAGKADFSEINGKKNLYIGTAIHKTFLEVGEEGTEAAGATAVIMTKTSIAHDTEDNIEFKADRPFIYIVKDNQTGAILFIGRYIRP